MLSRKHKNVEQKSENANETVGDSIEFWKEGKFRLHERELWRRLDFEHKWSIDNLYP